jgi:cyclophilin family peptidyl-prolyl cis-trans isomerase
MSKTTKQNPVVNLETSLGDIRIELWPDKAPETVANFLGYVKEGFYDGLIFHRVISNFVVQTGGYEPGLIYRQPTQPCIKNEADNGLSNERGTLAMARALPIDSAAAQFFINMVDNPRLNHQGQSPQEFGYAVFGQVIGGMDKVDKMAWIPVGKQGDMADVPDQDIVILKAVVERE